MPSHDADAFPPRRFEATILKQGRNAYVRVPEEVSRAFAPFAEKDRIRISGRPAGTEIRANLVPRGDGHWLFMHAGMRAAARVEVGDVVELAISAVPWDRVPIPSDARGFVRSRH